MAEDKSKDIEENTVEIDPKEVPWWCSYRLSLAFFGFLGFVNLYSLRVNMSVAMVCMINQTAVALQTEETANDLAGNNTGNGNGNGEDLNCYALHDANATKTYKEGEFDWDKETQGIVLGSFFWGYLLTQIPGGWLAERFGGKRILGYFMFAAGVATLLTPVGATASPYLLLVLRIIIGIGQGVVFPAMHNLWSRWAPPLERSKLIGFTYAGAQIGNVITFPMSGLLCDYGFAGGWPSIFYVLGMFSIVWFVLWMIFVSDSPAQCRRITPIERRYIETTIGARADQQTTRQELGTPWKAIFTSKAVWAIIVAHTCSNWGTYTLLTNIPTYMREVLKFDIKTNGALSAIPYIAFWGCINLGGVVADYMRTRGWRTATVRKISLALGTVVPAVFLVGTGYVTCANPFSAVVLLTIGLGMSGFQYSGCMVNHVDIAPPFAGILFGVSNTFATASGILAPYVIGRVTKHQTQAEWQVVFYIAAVIYIVGIIFFAIFAQGEIQDWVKPYMYSDDKTDRKEAAAATPASGGANQDATKV